MNQHEFQKVINNIAIDEVTQERILRTTLNELPEREETMKKKMTIKKGLVIALAAAMAVGISVSAGSRIVSEYGFSSSIPEYTSLPSEKECNKVIGYAPVLIDTFDNGYSFDNASVVHNDRRDENDKSVEKYDSINLRYSKDGDKVDISADKVAIPFDLNGEEADVLDGISIYYSSYRNKLVPPDYEMTEEDKKLEENGELVFSWGSTEVEINTVQNVIFEKEGIYYNLLQIDGKLSKAELVDMAKEIIEK